MKENTKKILIDTSFLAKLLGLDPPKQDMAIKKVQNNKLIAPMLITYEIGNTLLKYPMVDPRKFWQVFEGLYLELISPSECLVISKTAKKYDLTFYNASYVTILQSNLEIDSFLTFDKDFSGIKDSRVQILK